MALLSCLPETMIVEITCPKNVEAGLNGWSAYTLFLKIIGGSLELSLLERLRL